MQYRERRKSGHAVIEVALMSPWILLLFLAIFDFGYFMYAGTSVANAARAAALEMAQQDSTRNDQVLACSVAKEELKSLPNIGPGFAGTCNASPLVVTITNNHPALDDAADGTTGDDYGARVRVTYTSIQLFPLPWMMGRMTLSRQADVRVYGE